MGRGLMAEVLAFSYWAPGLYNGPMRCELKEPTVFISSLVNHLVPDGPDVLKQSNQAGHMLCDMRPRHWPKADPWVGPCCSPGLVLVGSKAVPAGDVVLLASSQNIPVVSKKEGTATVVLIGVNNGKRGCSSDLGSGPSLRWVSDPGFDVESLTVPSLSTVLPTAQTQKGFWEYFSQSSRDKGRAEQIQQQKLAREPASLKDSLEQDLNMDKFLEKLGTLDAQARELPRLPQEMVDLSQQLQEELEEVKARLDPYMAEMHERVGWNLQGLRQQLMPYTTELMEQVALGVQELQEQLRMVGEDTKAQLLGGVDEARGLLQSLQNRVVHHTGRVKALFHPYAERLVTGIGHHVQELHRSVAPHTSASPARLSRCVQALSSKLTLKAKALHARIQQNLDQLRQELSAFTGAGLDAEEGAGPDPQVLSEEVRQRLQAFRQDTFQQIAAFTRAIDQETQEIQQQLAPPPPSHSSFAPFLQAEDGKAWRELQARLDDLWEDINYSLHDHGQGHLREP
ncbi:Apolipoprotein A-V [Galemys pyrenaicus]|uniref:Apolipoprotein A-V n=1 Tax=Galemys pyrenaicus TaxID=202257 RepID=A0A8J6AI96_GALPY|nr:Apolipoprotein A-V [Galemys pyrenaicus]